VRDVKIERIVERHLFGSGTGTGTGTGTGPVDPTAE